ncbi:DUF1559 domain-containing protein [bacterium]|nr:DUF1559 domain-containing protein [bacterium]
MLSKRVGDSRAAVIVGLAAVVIILLLLMAKMFPGAIPDADELSGRKEQLKESEWNVKYIVLAIHNYHDKNNSLPPAVIRDANGKPMYSWRVAILPFLTHKTENEVFPEFDLNQPWDSPHNLEVAKNMPSIYASPALSSDQISKGLTTYKAIAGPRTALSTETAFSLLDVKRGTSNTFIGIEDTQQPVLWTQPVDISPEEFLLMNLDDGYFHGVLMSRADGSSEFFTEKDKEELSKMLSVDEEEPEQAEETPTKP